MTVRVVSALIRGGFGTLLCAVRSSGSDYAGCWEYPGGKVESGESDAQALYRECREELGVDILVSGLRCMVTIPLDREIVVAFYEVEIFDGQVPQALTADRIQWRRPDEIIREACMPGIFYSYRDVIEWLTKQ